MKLMIESILSIVNRAGIPIAIWPSTQTTQNGQELRKELDDLLFGCTLKELPDVVRSKRVEALANQELSKYNFTLLWDDPTRRPPLDPHDGVQRAK